MTAVELRLTLLQEIATILDDEVLVKKALTSIRRLKQATSNVDQEDREPTKEEMLDSIKNGLLAIKARKDGKETKGMFKDVNELLNEI
ncbi:hypothetical protein [Parabacteroides chongii]|uniref:hypothetical protein n=1 Tax=Parabacteroides chongii TaxID=2685834 RepID=UPI00240E5C30|nr:hypothetical protein [Parabacteroides chongii]WFE83288.1 hypothetical protein P3L47_14165 [Parabacteroides chongii]